MPENRGLQKPGGLAIAGSKLWKRVNSEYKLRSDELILLEQACRTLDTIANLDAALVGQPLLVLGSMGQQREHPLLSEVRQQRMSLARLLRQMELPDLDSMPGVNEHRKAALSRWAAAHG